LLYHGRDLFYKIKATFCNFILLPDMLLPNLHGYIFPTST
jgi:hypothetical protein